MEDEIFERIKNVYSYSDIDVGMFKKASDKCADYDNSKRCREKVRKQLAKTENGRYHKMLKETHKFVSNLDKTEKREFARRNPDLYRRVQEFAQL